MSVYIKTAKDANNAYGLRKLTSNENPFLTPCILAFDSQPNLKDNNAMLTRGAMRFARIRTKYENASCVTIEDMDVSAVTIDFPGDKYDRIEQLMPYINELIESNPSLEELGKAFRNINVFSYSCMRREKWIN